MSLFKKSTKNETQYPFYSVHMAFTRDGLFLRPFIINSNKTAIKDMESGKIATIPNREADSKRELSSEELHPALQELYNIPNILSDSLASLLYNTTPSHEVIPGKAFESLNLALRHHDVNYSRKNIFLETDGPYSDWQKELCTYSDLKSALIYTKYTLREEYKKQQKQHDIQTNKQLQSKKIEQIAKQSLDF